MVLAEHPTQSQVSGVCTGVDFRLAQPDIPSVVEH